MKPQTIQIKLPRPHAAQQAILKQMARFTVLCCGRRFGKTQLAQILAVQAVLRGEAVAYAAPIYKQTRKTWKSIASILKPVVQSISEQDKVLTTLTGGEFAAYSLDTADSIRGAGYDLLIVDEAAFVPDLQEAWLKVLRPMLSDRQGDALFISTPNGMSNYFFQLYAKGLGEDSEWASFRYPTSANPFIQPSEIEAAKAELPALVFEQEYLAEFVVSEGSVFGSIRHALVPDDQQPQPKERYVGGVDWGQQDDYTVLSIMASEANREVALYRWRKMSWVDMRAGIVEACKRWKVEKLIVEKNSASSNVEALILELQAAGLDVTVEPRTMTAPLKAQIVTTMYNGLHRDGLKLLDIDDATRELMAYTSKQGANGMWSYSHPEGGHDDTVDARMWAYYGLTRMVR